MNKDIIDAIRNEIQFAQQPLLEQIAEQNAEIEIMLDAVCLMKIVQEEMLSMVPPAMMDNFVENIRETVIREAPKAYGSEAWDDLNSRLMRFERASSAFDQTHQPPSPRDYLGNLVDK